MQKGVVMLILGYGSSTAHRFACFLLKERKNILTELGINTLGEKT